MWSNLNIVVSMVILMSLSSLLYAAEQSDLTGTWSKWGIQTAVGTGQIDTILKVSGKPGSFLVD